MKNPIIQRILAWAKQIGGVPPQFPVYQWMLDPDNPAYDTTPEDPGLYESHDMRSVDYSQDLERENKRDNLNQAEIVDKETPLSELTEEQVSRLQERFEANIKFWNQRLQKEIEQSEREEALAAAWETAASGDTLESLNSVPPSETETDIEETPLTNQYLESRSKAFGLIEEEETGSDLFKNDLEPDLEME